MSMFGFLRTQKILRALLIGALLLQAAPLAKAEARPRRAKVNPWQAITPAAPAPSIKWPGTTSITGMNSPAVAESMGARQFSRSLDWEKSGFLPQAKVPEKKKLSELLPQHQLPEVVPPLAAQPQSPQPLYQLSGTGGGAGGGAAAPITGAQPQGPLQPAATIGTPVLMDDLVLTAVLRLPADKNISIKALEFRDADIRDVFQGLANLIKLNLMLANDVTGTINIMFHDITLEEAFNSLLNSQDLAFSWDGSILRIFKAANAPMKPSVFTIQNTNAAQIKPIIDRLLTPNRGRSEVDARLNAIMVTDSPNVLDTIRKLLPEIDVKESSVEVTSRPLTEVFYLDYVDATTLTQPIAMVVPTAQIQAFSSSQASQAGAAGGGATGGRMDMMIITETQSNLDRIRELIEKLDVAPIQVIIDAHIYEIDLNEEERMGINWQKSVPIQGTTENIFSASISPEEATAGGTGVFRFGSLSVNQFQALLAMLKTHSFAKVLSQPVLTTLNNRSANITVGQAIPYVSASIIDPNTGQVSNQVSQANANITLTVTPSVTGNDEVFLQINPTISSVLGFTSLGGNSTPNLSNRSAQTQVIVRNNHTIVIGGMIKTDKSDSISKVPFFGDLPGIGKMFQKKTTKESRTELIIFITPHIVRTGSNKNVTVEAPKGETSLMPRLSLTP